MLLFIVFVSAFGAATILPISSEVAVVLAYEQGQNALLIWLLASLGNTLGAVVNYILGRYLMRFSDRPWFPVKAVDIQKGSTWFHRYGVWTLLFSWVPLIGDVFTFIAGTVNVRFSVFLVLVAVGKSLRYAFIIMALMSFF